VQVYGGCAQACAFCPWPKTGAKNGVAITEQRDFMEAGRFDSLLEKITAFSGDAIIDLSLWGELSIHPQKMELIEMVLRRPELDLVIETSGIGWKDNELDKCAALAKAAAPGKNPFRLSWIVSLDTADPERYREIRGSGFAEANEMAKKLLALFTRDAYVQAVRTAGAEDDIEKFYRSWKEITPNTSNIIIQKYDDFCGFLPKKQASDLSPIQRQPCWHLMRDMPVLIDGTAPLCREQIAASNRAINGSISPGNVFTEPLETIWERGRQIYMEQAGRMSGGKKYNSICAGCDEYYTYNF
jgi:spiro-SPASM protein